MAKEYSTLEELYEDIHSHDFIVGNEKKSKINKWFMFSKYYNFLSFFDFYKNITLLSSHPDFVRQKVVSKYSRDHWKVVFDINAQGVPEEKYQQATLCYITPLFLLCFRHQVLTS